MPYPTEHSCRLKDPGQFDRFRRGNCDQKHDGKCIDVIYGIKENKSEIQALRYPKSIWSVEAARSHCKSRDGSFELGESEDKMKTPANGFWVKAKGKEAEMSIYQEIGTSWGGVTAKDFAKELKALGDINQLTLHISSPGGDVFEGNAIYNLLRQHPAHKTVSIDGIAASIASVVAMAGDRISMADNAVMMIHPAWMLAIGNAEVMRKSAGMLDKLDLSILKAYARRVKLDQVRLSELLQAETWMNADEALEYGFVDEITDALEIAACFDLRKFGYKNVPQRFVNSANPATDDSRAICDKLAHMQLVAQRIRTASGA